LASLKGLVELINKFAVMNPGTQAYHYISFLVRIPILDVHRQPNNADKFRDFNADLVYADDRVKATNYMYKSGSFVINPEKAQ